MSESPNRLIRFWQELKRRKVFSVVTTYAATSYIIIEVTNNLVEPLSLPAWIAKLVILLLGAGLPVVVILSWIFDFTLQGIKKTESLEELEKKEVVTQPVRRKLRASYVLNAILIVVVIVLAYPKIFKQDTLEKLRSSGERIVVAIMPFQNMTNDTVWNIWQDGIQDILINKLTDSEELKVRQTESTKGLLQSEGLTNKASLTPFVASTISQKLDANVFIYGSIIKAGAMMRLNAQVIDSKTQESLKSFQIEGLSSEDSIFHTIDSLSIMLKNYLIIAKLQKELPTNMRVSNKALGSFGSTSSPEAFRFYIVSTNAFMKGDYSTAIKMASKAIAIDSNFVNANYLLMQIYFSQGLYEEAKMRCSGILKKKYQLPIKYQLYTNIYYALLFETPNEQIECFKQAQTLDDQDPSMYSSLGTLYNSLDQYDKGASEYEKALEILNKRHSTLQLFIYSFLGKAYHEMGEYKKEEKLYKKAEKNYSFNKIKDTDREYYRNLIFRKAVLALTKGEMELANKYIEKCTSLHRENLESEVDIISNIAYIYDEAGLMDKAEEYYRKSLSLEIENIELMNNLAWFLIDKDKNINEGLELVTKALEIDPYNWNMLDTKGWGLYKQGKYKEALEILQKSWELRRKYAAYDHTAFLHLEAAKKAVANP